MDRKEAIEIIEGLFPADSKCSDIAGIGQRLLDQSKQEVESWRTEPAEVLTRYAELCIEEEIEWDF
ncbi:MAG: hypothetical protein GY874_21900 [Desulfobacteraceae bacterium]|nr:hypothetical protein [Desulfobacteraceae bacterium]